MKYPRQIMLLVAAALAAAGCTYSAAINLDNQSRQEVIVEYFNGSTWHRRYRAPAGAVATGLAMNPNHRLRAGDCIYSYPDLDWTVERPVWKPQDRAGRRTLFQVQVEPDFTLRLFPLTEDGQIWTETTTAGWPARPTTNCGESG